MNKLYVVISIVLLAVYASGCNGSNTNSSNDTAGAPAVADTMPVLHPGNLDSNGVIQTPPTNDSNVIMPDSAIKQ